MCTGPYTRVVWIRRRKAHGSCTAHTGRVIPKHKSTRVVCCELPATLKRKNRVSFHYFTHPLPQTRYSLWKTLRSEKSHFSTPKIINLIINLQAKGMVFMFWTSSSSSKLLRRSFNGGIGIFFHKPRSENLRLIDDFMFDLMFRYSLGRSRRHNPRKSSTIHTKNRYFQPNF